MNLQSIIRRPPRKSKAILYGQRIEGDEFQISGPKETADRAGHTMDLDQEVCLCFHVSRRKLESFIRHEQPKRASQLAECYGAGTGCKWCVRYLKAIFEAANHQPECQASPDTENRGSPSSVLPTAEQYAAMRRKYRMDQKQGGPAGADAGQETAVEQDEGADDRSNDNGQD